MNLSPFAQLALHRLRHLLRDQRGQGMVEYSTITFAILALGAVTAMAAPWPGMNQTLIQALYSALQIHVNSYYYALSLAVP